MDVGNRCGCRKVGMMYAGICHSYPSDCLKRVTSTLEEDFDGPDDPDVVSLLEIKFPVQIKENTNQVRTLLQKNLSKKRN